jgi:alpha-ribazole phosphatase
MVVTRWWWIRHAPVTGDGGRIYGQRDVDCDVSDGAAFAVLARSLPRDAVWVTSHLKRALDTARAITEAGLAAPPPIIEPDLAEQNFGEWQGQLRTEVFARNPDKRGFWLAPAHLAPPGGESFVQLVERVSVAVRRLGRDHAGRDIVAIAHGGTIRAALALALNLEPATALAFSTDNLALTRIDQIDSPEGDAWRVSAVNLPPSWGCAAGDHAGRGGVARGPA